VAADGVAAAVSLGRPAAWSAGTGAAGISV